MNRTVGVFMAMTPLAIGHLLAASIPWPVRRPLVITAAPVPEDESVPIGSPLGRS
jgi:uncharacterized protein (DUF2062 family)